MRIEYSFGWERDNETEGGSYSEHSVAFYFSYLPSSVLPATALSNNSLDRSGGTVFRIKAGAAKVA